MNPKEQARSLELLKAIHEIEMHRDNEAMSSKAYAVVRRTWMKEVESFLKVNASEMEKAA